VAGSQPAPTPQPTPQTAPTGKPMAVILSPGGKPVGQKFKTNKDTTRTVSKGEYDGIRQNLIEGATPGTAKNYSGTVYTRSDGRFLENEQARDRAPP
jgi:hypothetical protein